MRQEGQQLPRALNLSDIKLPAYDNNCNMYYSEYLYQYYYYFILFFSRKLLFHLTPTTNHEFSQMREAHMIMSFIF